MNQIQNKTVAARRRLVFSRFCRSFCVTLAIAWSVAALVLAARSIWVVPGSNMTLLGISWQWSWVGGSTLVALLASGIWTGWTCPTLSAVAAEIDEKFHLAQRLRSSLELSDADRETPMGKALVEDAAGRADRLQLSEHFAIRPARVGWLPLLPAAMIAAAMLLNPAQMRMAAASLSGSNASAQIEQIKQSTKKLKKKISEQRKKAEAAGLKDAAEMFSKIEADIDKMTKRGAIDPKEALIAINDLKKQLDERRKAIGSPETVQKALAKMSDTEKGPADSIVKAMKEGKFADAKEQAKALAEKIRKDDLTPKQKEELQKQATALAEKLKDAAEKHGAEKQQLQQQIEQAEKEGRSEEAQKLQQQMNDLQSRDEQMQQMQQMAQSMSEAAQSIAKGDSEQAAQAMDEMAQQMEEMENAMEQLQDIEETLDTLSQSKDQMRCKNCSGNGCEKCKGNGQGDGDAKDANNGKGGSKYGLGKGSGLSGPEDNSDGDKYESQVRGEPKRGRGLNSGYADGPNRKGVTREDVKQAVLNAISDESDPLESQTLPRAERDHATEYFNKLRGSK